MPSFSRFPTLIAAMLATVAVAAASCGSDSGGASSAPTTDTAAPTTGAPTTAAPTTAAPTTTVAPDPRAGRPFGVTTSQLTFVDATRETPASDFTASVADRTIGVWLTLPDGAEAAPLIVFSHGMAGHPRKFEDLHTRWAEAGYAVAAPVFPLSNDGVEGSFFNSHDVPNQPGDVTFVLDQLLEMSADESNDLFGLFDPERIAASGLSAGGFTTYDAAVSAESRDARFLAAVVMSARATAGLRGDDSSESGAADLPVMVLHGDADPLIPVASAEEAFGLLRAPRVLIVLLGGGHAGPFEDADDGFEPQVEGHADLVFDATVAFWDRYLLDLDEAEAEMVAAASRDGLSTVEIDLG